MVNSNAKIGLPFTLEVVDAIAGKEAARRQDHSGERPPGRKRQVCAGGSKLFKYTNRGGQERFPLPSRRKAIV